VQFGSQDFIEHSVAVRAQRNTVGLSITPQFVSALPFFFIDDVRGVR
jgi:hypothetical protein